MVASIEGLKIVALDRLCISKSGVRALFYSFSAASCHSRYSIFIIFVELLLVTDLDKPNDYRSSIHCRGFSCQPRLFSRPAKGRRRRASAPGVGACPVAAAVGAVPHEVSLHEW